MKPIRRRENDRKTVRAHSRAMGAIGGQMGFDPAGSDEFDKHGLKTPGVQRILKLGKSHDFYNQEEDNNGN